MGGLMSRTTSTHFVRSGHDAGVGGRGSRLAARCANSLLRSHDSGIGCGSTYGWVGVPITAPSTTPPSQQLAAPIGII